MDDWQVGDLALCVDDSTRECGRKCPARKGALYTVAHAGCYGGQWGIRLSEAGCYDYPAYRASRFRKVTPPEADEFDREVIALLTGKPEQVTG